MISPIYKIERRVSDLNMYSFRDVSESKRDNNSFTFLFDGVDFISAFNNEFYSCRLLSVSGRGLVNLVHHSQDVPGRDGSVFLSKSLANRDIKVKLLLSAKNDLDFRLLFERLNFLVNKDTCELSFSDENRIYYANFISADMEEETSNSSVVTLNFVCYLPYKFSSDVKRVASSSIVYNGDVDVFPKFTLTFASDVSEIRLLHVESGKYIRMVGSYLANNVLMIDMEKRSITLNGRSDLHKFDMVNSRFFPLCKGRNTINVTDNHSFICEFREVYL